CDDEPFELAPDACVQLAHPLSMSDEERDRWRARFEDYELLPPIAQLDREVFEWPAATLGSDEEPRCRGWLVHPVRLRRLADAGWREQRWDGVVRELSLSLGADVSASLRLVEGYRAADLGR